MRRRIDRATMMVVAMGCSVGLAWAVPSVTNVVMTQSSYKTVEITYDLLDDAAIITVAIETNGVALADDAMTHLSGDVAEIIQTGTAKKIIWDMGKDLPEHKLVNARAKVKAWSTNVPPDCLVIDLTDGTATNAFPVKYYTSVNALPLGGLTNTAYKTTCMVMRKIPGNLFNMGDNANSVAVALSKPYFVNVYEVTQSQWTKVMGAWPFVAKTNAICPAGGVSYFHVRENPVGGGGGGQDDATVNWPANTTVVTNSFVGVLRIKTGLAGFDLPTEAQWEHACRAGTSSDYNNGGSTTNDYNAVGWWNGNSTTTHEVGLKLPNAWGLYDMHGNVWEWCLDYPASSLVGATDPLGAASGSNREGRGGDYTTGASNGRSQNRDSAPPSRSVTNPEVGFRLVRNLP